MSHIRTNPRWRALILGSIMMLPLLLSACGGANPASTAATGASSAVGSSMNSSTSGGSASSTDQQAKMAPNKQQAGPNGPQYLIKSLNVTMEVADTRKAADNLQTWISTTDPHATSAGTSYQLVGDNVYNISMTFSVQASLYPQVYRYLQDYAVQQKGHLLGFNETVQDVTNDYVDTQSQLKNLRGEQTRLLDLMSHAQALGDVLSIEQRLTDVEGRIESIEAHLNSLTGQITYYTVSITLQPIAVANPQPANNGWNVGQIFHDAFAASLGFAQGLVTFFIWLLAFSVYIIPMGVIAWFAMRWRARSRRIMPPPSIPTPSPQG
ncbi:MAG: DUF4349 domain-containing protein [Chloroflexi bacterium]|nr:DUF4349 domain-containing protein [Chloroflexota bacterium]